MTFTLEKDYYGSWESLGDSPSVCGRHLGDIQGIHAWGDEELDKLYSGGGGRMVGNSDFKKRVSVRLGDAGEEGSKMAYSFWSEWLGGTLHQ